MRYGWGAVVLLAAGIGLTGCGPSVETPRTEPAPAPMTKESFYQRGQQFRVERQSDSAAVYFLRAAAMDSAFHQPLQDLALMHYEQAQLAAEKSRARQEHLRAARAQFVRLEDRGVRDADIYERLCEISSMLNDDRAFLAYAKKNAALYPYDRQVYNLARAYYETGDFQSVITVTKGAVDQFPESPYLSSYYRIMGKAYTRIDRDQTAERTLTAGIKAVDARMAVLKKNGGDYRATEHYRRYHEDTVQMLLMLKQLHTTYKAADKLAQVERRLKEEGYDR